MVKIVTLFTLFNTIKSSNNFSNNLRKLDTEKKTGIILNDIIATNNIHNCTEFSENRGCMYHGFCHDNGICSCDPEYVTINCNHNLQCCQQRKKQWVTFLLAWLTSTFAGPFWYAHQNTIATILLCISLVLCCSPCIITCFTKKNKTPTIDDESCLVISISYLFKLWIFVLTIVCIIIAGMNNIKQKIGDKDIKMEPW